MTVYVRQSSTLVSFPKDGQSWVILSAIEQRIKEKIEKVGMPLKDWDIKIYRGVLTGCNEAFIIDSDKRKELIEKDANSAEIIRPILRGRDIRRYGYNFADLYVINTHNGIPNKNIPPIDIKNYPAVKEHLDKYW
ncbi:MAG: type II restriction endonuclease, partial [Treponema sp.]|nr:type II restriction endonuclease [Treponema sp.]